MSKNSYYCVEESFLKNVLKSCLVSDRYDSFGQTSFSDRTGLLSSSNMIQSRVPAPPHLASMTGRRFQPGMMRGRRRFPIRRFNNNNNVLNRRGQFQVPWGSKKWGGLVTHDLNIVYLKIQCNREK